MYPSEKVLGIVVIARHGDRQGFYQSPTTYTPSGTIITPLGNQEEFQLGQFLRSRYLNSSSSSYISGVNNSIVNVSQIHVRADAGGEGGVILSSAMSLTQGLFPANPQYRITLANGSTIEGPLGGYQYLTIESVEPGNDISLEGWTSCGAFDTHTATFYNSSIFKEKANESRAFLNSLPPYLDGRPVTLENMWNIFDYMNVQNIHNKTFHDALPPSYLAQARALANFHEYGVFSDTNIGGIGNIAGRTVLPSILDGFSSIVNSSDPLKFVYLATAYKPFLSLFNMTGVAEMNPDLAGIVNYAAAVVLEVRKISSSSEPIVRFTFRNGTIDDDLTSYNFLNSSGGVPLSTFVNYLAPFAIETTAEWCAVCGNTADRGCSSFAGKTLLAAEDTYHKTIGTMEAEFLGACAGVCAALAILIILFMLGLVHFGYKDKPQVDPKKKTSPRSNVSSEKLARVS